MSHELFLIARQKTKIRNAFANNISTNIKHSKAQLSKTIQSVGFLGALLSKCTGPLTKVNVSLARNLVAPLATMTSASPIDGAIQRQMRGQEVLRGRKEITLVISDENMDGIVRITKSLEKSVLLINGVSKTVKHELKSKKVDFLAFYYKL